MQQLLENKSAGLTMLELMITLAIIAIILSLSVPSFSSFRETQRLISAAEQVYAHLQQARSESIARNVPAYVNFNSDGSETWMYGVSSVNSLCDVSITSPLSTGACVLIVDNGNGVTDAADFVLSRSGSAVFQDVSMEISNFSSGSTQIRFDPVRGMASSGQIDLQSNDGQLRIKVSLLGRVFLCSPDGSVAKYSSSGC
jgi:type IV fimbrial biogenesis protein FimT